MVKILTDYDRELYIGRLSKIKAEMDELKAEKDTIEAELMKIAQRDLANTKYKTVKYPAPGCALTATMTDSVKITYSALLQEIFGKAYNDLTKTTTKIELTEPAKRLISGVWKGDYDNRSTVDDVIDSIGLDEKTAKLVRKKCKGVNYDKDVYNLQTIAGLSNEGAQEYAYMLTEAAVWAQFKTLLNLNGVNDGDGIQAVIDKIQAAFVVEQGTKIMLTEV